MTVRLQKMGGGCNGPVRPVSKTIIWKKEAPATTCYTPPPCLFLFKAYL